MARWKAVVVYNSEHGLVDVEYEIEELDEIAEIVECGPHWDTVERITITLARRYIEGLTVEASEKL